MPKRKKRGTKRKRPAKVLLEYLNKTYLKIHRRYERLFWTSYMGDHSVDVKFDVAKNRRETFRSNGRLLEEVRDTIAHSQNKTDLRKLKQWERFFSLYQTPGHLKGLYEEITKLETLIQKRQAGRKEGFIHPKTMKFVRASRVELSNILATHTDEKMRKACFKALEELAIMCIDEYIELVNLKNQYAHALGFEDFYAYKVMTEEGMSKNELFKIFDTIYNETKHAFKTIRRMETKKPGLRKPWNKAYMLSGDFTKESDQYFPFEQALERWGRSFAALGIQFHGGVLQLDLLDRKGKYENGFCHWPDLVHYKNGKRLPGSSNFTCNVAYGQVGSAEDGYTTLFHEGGHAAHLLNSTQTEVCMNNEYPPASTAWDETQSMFLDSMFSSIEWMSRYAKNKDGDAYPFKLFERELRRLHKLSPLGLMGISSVMSFEKQIYETKNLTKNKVLKIAKKTYIKYSDSSVTSCRLLSVPHIYSWESSCSYHGYGLAQLAVVQWRQYFYKKYGYIVDNPKVGKELKRMWAYASSETFSTCVKFATGRKLSPKSYLKVVNTDLETVLKRARKRIADLQKVRKYDREIDLGAKIRMVHGKEIVATNRKSFEHMSTKYASWLRTQRITRK